MFYTSGKDVEEMVRNATRVVGRIQEKRKMIAGEIKNYVLRY